MVERVRVGEEAGMMEGIESCRSRYGFEETVTRLQASIEAKGLTMFCVVDHAGAAAAVGLKMPPTKVLVFGAPAAGTPLMLGAPSVALDLPLKLLVAEEPEGVRVSWNAAAWLAQRHGLAVESSRALGGAAMLGRGVE